MEQVSKNGKAQSIETSLVPSLADIAEGLRLRSQQPQDPTTTRAVAGTAFRADGARAFGRILNKQWFVRENGDICVKHKRISDSSANAYNFSDGVSTEVDHDELVFPCVPAMHPLLEMPGQTKLSFTVATPGGGSVTYKLFTNGTYSVD